MSSKSEASRTTLMVCRCSSSTQTLASHSLSQHKAVQHLVKSRSRLTLMPKPPVKVKLTSNWWPSTWFWVGSLVCCRQSINHKAWAVDFIMLFSIEFLFQLHLLELLGQTTLLKVGDKLWGDAFASLCASSCTETVSWPMTSTPQSVLIFLNWKLSLLLNCGCADSKQILMIWRLLGLLLELAVIVHGWSQHRVRNHFFQCIAGNL